ncbi:MAG: TonB-dependent receptor [Opitutaceae bacterium]|jgi:outer membrane receptor protein involved in Fe transport
MSVRIYLPIFFLAAAAAPLAADDNQDTAANQTPIAMDPVVVTASLDKARDDIVPSLGASTFNISSEQITLQPLGTDAPFNQIMLRAPGVAQDSAANGDLHVRGEHANLQYRINDVLLPEGITGFGLELDPRFVGGMQLITGSLPAQYGFRTAGVVDIHTKSGSFENGGEADVFGGSFGTSKASFESGGTAGKLGYFIDGSFDHNGIGIENPTASKMPIHDATDQYKTFVYLSRILNDTSRISVMGSASYSNFQVPNTTGLAPGTSPDGNPWLPGTFDSASLNEHQNEQNYYGIIAYQKSTDGLHFQLAGYGRYSSVHFIPDPTGDLFFNGVASDVDRKIYSGGLQADASYLTNGPHTLRGGVTLLSEHLTADTTTTVFPVDGNGDPTGSPFPVVNNGTEHALFFGLYLQDEWKLTSRLTLNYGARCDVYSSSFDHENQFSPRVNLIYRPTNATTLHAGYARYFTPPPLENVSAATVTLFNGTSNASAVTQDDPVQAERSHYFDAGISQTLSSRLQVGLDGYYKTARNQLDDGLFGQSLILSAFNYQKGKVYGVEFTASYAAGGFSAYANLARSEAQGKDWSSAQFLFDPSDLAYVQDHWIHLDHDQRLSGSCGASYTWQGSRGSTRAYVDALYGTGLRTDATDNLGNTIPNGGTVPAYATINVGVERRFNLAGKRTLKARLDVVNLTDKSYELRNGSGVGVNAAQYGMRRGLFGSLGLSF